VLPSAVGLVQIVASSTTYFLAGGASSVHAQSSVSLPAIVIWALAVHHRSHRLALAHPGKWMAGSQPLVSI